MAQDDQHDNFQSNPPQQNDDYQTHKQIQKEEKLADDYETPFSEPQEQLDEFPNTHQVHDSKSNIDSHESYDEGADAAALDQPGTTIDPGQSAVVDYNPKKDKRKDGQQNK